MQLEQLTIEGPDYTRTCWFAAGPSADHALCIFLDGQHYLDSLDARATLDAALADHALPPMSFVFVPSETPHARHHDLVCNDRFARFIATDAVAAARRRVPTARASHNLICGVSLSGLASAHLALTHPHVFSAALCQSGSFWWDDQRFATLAHGAALPTSRFWLSVGDQEVAENVSHPPTGIYQRASQITGVQSAVDAFRATGAAVHHHIFHGGHAFAPWAAELLPALRWLTAPSSPSP